MREKGHQTDLGQLLTRFGAQLHAANRMGADLEETIGDLVRHAAGTGLPARAALQRLDMLVQSLENLALFAEAIAAAVPPGTTVDPREAAGRLKLRALSAALMETARPNAGLDGLDIHLF